MPNLELLLPAEFFILMDILVYFWDAHFFLLPFLLHFYFASHFIDVIYDLNNLNRLFYKLNFI